MAIFLQPRTILQHRGDQITNIYRSIIGIAVLPEQRQETFAPQQQVLAGLIPRHLIRFVNVEGETGQCFSFNKRISHC